MIRNQNSFKKMNAYHNRLSNRAILFLFTAVKRACISQNTGTWEGKKLLYRLNAFPCFKKYSIKAISHILKYIESVRNKI